MKKIGAIKFINAYLRKDILNRGNCNFSNLNATTKNWWFDIRSERFDSDLYLIFAAEKELILVFLPQFTFTNLKDHFYIRKDNNKVHLIVSNEKGTLFLRELGGKSVDFKPFVDKRIPYFNSGVSFGSQPDQSLNNLPETNKQIIIKNDEKGFSYDRLFWNYLKGGEKIILQDPYLRYPHQIKNFIEFCYMISLNKKEEEVIELEVRTWNTDEFYDASKEIFDSLVSEMSEIGIKLEYKFEDHHDRFITSDSGWKIVLGRGLDIFQKPERNFSMATVDQTKRKCRACEISYLPSGI